MESPSNNRMLESLPVTWPVNLSFPSHVSSSKQKRVALIFLSGIRAQGLLMPAPMMMGGVQQLEEERALLKSSSTTAPVVKIDPSITPSGAMMKGDVHARYIRGAMLQFDPALPHRVFLSWDRSYPAFVFSVLPSKRSSAGPEFNSIKGILDGVEPGLSHADIINPTVVRRRVGKRKNASEWDERYSPDSVDDPRIRLGRHRVVQNVPGMRLSILPYAKLRVLKDELNATFREQHPNLFVFLRSLVELPSRGWKNSANIL